MAHLFTAIFAQCNYASLICGRILYYKQEIMYNQLVMICTNSSIMPKMKIVYVLLSTFNESKNWFRTMAKHFLPPK